VLEKEKKINTEALRLQDIGVTGKIFCLSMQRSGTSSVGDFLEQWGFKRAGHPMSRSQGWTRNWFNGDFEAIFNDPVFQEHEVFEDDPFWCPEFYKVIYHRVPGSRFVLLTRDADAWFKSMVRHSNGFSMGQTDIHAKIYRREDELLWLEKNIPGFRGEVPRVMTLYDKSGLYKAVYERHNTEVQRFFAGGRSGALFCSSLTDKTTWPGLKEWLRLPDKSGVRLDVHTHKARGEFTHVNLLQTAK